MQNIDISDELWDEIQSFYNSENNSGDQAENFIAERYVSKHALKEILFKKKENKEHLFVKNLEGIFSEDFVNKYLWRFKRNPIVALSDHFNNNSELYDFIHTGCPGPCCIRYLMNSIREIIYGKHPDSLDWLVTKEAKENGVLDEVYPWEEWSSSLSKREKEILSEFMAQITADEMKKFLGGNNSASNLKYLAFCFDLFMDLERQNRRVTKSLVPKLLKILPRQSRVRRSLKELEYDNEVLDKYTISDVSREMREIGENEN